ncbi:MAG: hypothetical protein WBO10_05845 [Pyrinomonadaceae bacterium]
MQIAEFQRIIRVTDKTTIVRRIILERGCEMLSPEIENNLCGAVSKRFDVDEENIHIVGSAKLGFSIKPKSRYQAFHDDSDIDLAIADPSLFERVWTEVHAYVQTGEFWEKEREFYGYLQNGWIRPDLLPNANSFDFTTTWWNYFNALTASGRFGRYPIRGAIYMNRFFLETYQTICVEQCQRGT